MQLPKCNCTKFTCIFLKLQSYFLSALPFQLHPPEPFGIFRPITSLAWSAPLYVKHFGRLQKFSPAFAHFQSWFFSKPAELFCISFPCPLTFSRIFASSAPILWLIFTFLFQFVESRIEYFTSCLTKSVLCTKMMLWLKLLTGKTTIQQKVNFERSHGQSANL